MHIVFGIIITIFTVLQVDLNFDHNLLTCLFSSKLKLNWKIYSFLKAVFITYDISSIFLNISFNGIQV